MDLNDLFGETSEGEFLYGKLPELQHSGLAGLWAPKDDSHSGMMVEVIAQAKSAEGQRMAVVWVPFISTSQTTPKGTTWGQSFLRLPREEVTPWGVGDLIKGGLAVIPADEITINRAGPIILSEPIGARGTPLLEVK